MTFCNSRPMTLMVKGSGFMEGKRMSDIQRDGLVENFKDKDYRHRYVANQIQELLAAQIRLLRSREELSQKQLGERAGIQQPQISRLEDFDKPGVTLKTLERLAEAFDVGLVVRFAAFGEIVDWTAGLDVPGLGNDSYAPASYAYDLVAQGKRPSLSALQNAPCAQA